MQLPGEFSPFIVVGGVTPLPPLSGPTTKKTLFFMCVFPQGSRKKNPPLMARPLRGGGEVRPAGPSRKRTFLKTFFLFCCHLVQKLWGEKKSCQNPFSAILRLKKKFFSLMALLALPPPPLLMAWPLVEDFFCSFPKGRRT